MIHEIYKQINLVMFESHFNELEKKKNTPDKVVLVRPL